MSVEKRPRARLPTPATLVAIATVMFNRSMIIACPACSTRYAVPDSSIGVDGRTVRCAKCRHSWFQEGPELVEATAPAAARPVAASSSPTAPEHQQEAEAPAGEPSPREQEAALFARTARSVAQPPAVETPPAPAPVDEDPIPSFGAPTSRQMAEDAERPRVYDDNESISYADEAPSSFDFAPPFRPRRNWTKIGTFLAVIFAVITLGAAGAIAWGGLPDWVPIPRPTFAEAQKDLQLDFPRNRQDKRTLPNGTEFFGASGTVTNIGHETRNVPPILIVLRDSRDRIVYSWEVAAPKDRLKPGESVTINEAVTDVPKSAVAAEIGWKPS